MTRQIDADTLRTWLDEGRAMTVLDVRSDDARARSGRFQAASTSMRTTSFAKVEQGRSQTCYSRTTDRS